MKPITGEDVSKLTEGLLSDKHQVKDLTVDLTVKEIYRPLSSGQLDFGGSEYKEPDLEKVDTYRLDEDADYGWWNLEEGTYLVKFNETVEELEGLGLLSPHPRLLKTGATHPSLVVHEWEDDYVLPLNVGGWGLDIKENARISKLMIFE